MTFIDIAWYNFADLIFVILKTPEEYHRNSPLTETRDVASEDD